MYEVRSRYSFWGEPTRYYKKCFSSVWEAYDYLLDEDDIDTSSRVFRVRGGGEQEVCIRFLDRKYERYYNGTTK
jgi:hypothetical protein